MKHSFFALLVITLLVLPYNASAYGITGSFTDGTNEIQFDSFEGELLVVEAFSTTCSHCQDMHPELVKLYDEFNNDLEMVSLSINSQDTVDTVSQFKDDYPSEWIVGLAPDSNFKETYNIPGTPSVLLFDTVGELKACFVGTRDAEELSPEFQMFINDPSSYAGPLNEDGLCEGPSTFQQLLGSPIFLIIVMVSLYGIFVLVQRYLKNR